MKAREMHESNEMFQMLVGKTVSLVEYVDDFDGGITLHFTDGSMLTVCEGGWGGEGMLQVAAAIAAPDFTETNNVRGTK